MKRVIYCFLVLLLCPALICGCHGKPPDRRACFNQPFAAEINGELNGVAFTAKITGGGKDGEYTIQYLTPDILSQTELRVHLGTDGTPSGEARITRGELTLTQNAEDLRGLLLPLSTLLLLTQTEPATVQKDNDGYTFTFPDSQTLSVTDIGIPRALTAPNVTYQIVWWEQ
ncbi:MAG: hypothetical protein IJW55_06085 [Clostridia bacterium]|nr:hypothetical protein [Clostridia bacterium]